MNQLNSDSTEDLFRTYNASICSMEHKVSGSWSSKSVQYISVQLNEIGIFKDQGAGQRESYRTARHLIHDNLRDFIVSLPIAGRTFLLQSGAHVRCETGQFVVVPMAKPFAATIIGYGQSRLFTQLLVRVPGALLRNEVPDIDDFSSTALTLDSGTGRIMQEMVNLGFKEGAGLTPGQATDFERMLVRAIANSIVGSAQYAEKLKRRNAGAIENLFHVAAEHIEANLTNPFLTSASVAKYCRVSVRSLQFAFAFMGTTTVAYIRERRLKMCMRDISNPELRHISITDTAAKWGFDTPASFSRAYKAQFGRSPSADKRIAKTALQAELGVQQEASLPVSQWNPLIRRMGEGECRS